MITKKQKQWLRALGQTLPSKYQIGKMSIQPETIQLLDQGLLKNELIKIHILESVKEEQISIISDLLFKLQAELIQEIGHRVLIYRANPKARKIILPK